MQGHVYEATGNFLIMKMKTECRECGGPLRKGFCGYCDNKEKRKEQRRENRRQKERGKWGLANTAEE
jgi:hypothetical protein